MKQVVILAGGDGTRLKKVSGSLPKPMVLIHGKPLLQYLIEQCVKYNFLDVHLLVSYKSSIISDFFGSGRRYGVSITYHVESVPRGTAGALLDILQHLDDVFLVLYGDTFFDIDLGKIWDFHLKKRGDASLFLHPNDHPADSDLVSMNNDLRITNIYGYPHDGKWRRNLVNAALYVFSKKNICNINLPLERPDIAKNLFPLLVKSGRVLYGYLSTEYIKDMGTPERLKKIENDVKSGKVKSLRLASKKKALFLDRDGVINKEVDHLNKLDQLVLIDNIGKAIRKINQAGILAVVVTNQPVIARGELNNSDLQDIHNKLDTLLGLEGAYIDRVYYCPHHPDKGFKNEVKELKIDCDCRKPKPGLLLQAAKEMNISLQDSWLVGDSSGDILAGKQAGVKTILVKTGYGGTDMKYRVRPDLIADNLLAAVKVILKDAK